MTPSLPSAESSPSVVQQNPEGVSTADKRGKPRKTFLADVIYKQPGFYLGLVLGAGVGVWAAYRHYVRMKEGAVLTTDIGAAIGLLAVSLAAMTIIMGFLQDFYKDIIAAKGGPKEFFRPFEVVAVLSGSAVVIGIVSELEGASANKLSSGLFGLAIFLLTWAIVQSVDLVFMLARHGTAWFELGSGLARGEAKDTDDALSAIKKLAGLDSETKSVPEQSKTDEQKDTQGGPGSQER
jgi:hypothetical protein